MDKHYFVNSALIAMKIILLTNTKSCKNPLMNTSDTRVRNIMIVFDNKPMWISLIWVLAFLECAAAISACLPRVQPNQVYRVLWNYFILR